MFLRICVLVLSAALLCFLVYVIGPHFANVSQAPAACEDTLGSAMLAGVLVTHLPLYVSLMAAAVVKHGWEDNDTAHSLAILVTAYSVLVVKYGAEAVQSEECSAYIGSAFFTGFIRVPLFGTLAFIGYRLTHLRGSSAAANEHHRRREGSGSALEV